MNLQDWIGRPASTGGFERRPPETAAATAPPAIKALNYGLVAVLAMLPALVLAYRWATGS